MPREPLKTPVWPTDFVRLSADGGASYWWWSPETGPDYDGTWPDGSDPPQGLMIGDEDSGADLADGGCVVASWEYGPETESGPFERQTYDEYDPSCVQRMVERVIGQLNEERSTHPA